MPGGGGGSGGDRWGSRGGGGGGGGLLSQATGRRMRYYRNIQANWNENYTAEQNAAADRGARIFNAQPDRSRGAGTVFRVRPTRKRR